MTIVIVLFKRKTTTDEVQIEDASVLDIYAAVCTVFNLSIVMHTDASPA